MIIDRLSRAADGEPLVLGHRGFAALEVENTLPAFARAAGTAGVSGVELDVQLSRDDEVVVAHDRDLARLGGDPQAIAGLTAAELATRELRVERPAGPASTATGVPTLNAVVDAVPAPLLIDIELKSYSDMRPGLPEAVARLIHDRGIADRVLVSSFDPRLVRAFRTAAAGLGLRVVTAAIYSGDAEVPWLLRRGLGVRWSGSEVAKPSWASLLRRRPPRRWSLVWTVNDREVVERLTGRGVAGYIGDDPAALRRWITEAAARSGAPAADRPPETRP